MSRRGIFPDDAEDADDATSTGVFLGDTVDG
jgi:hypothetical protein